MKIHELKVWPRYFEQVRIGNKTFEIRLNDRNFQVRDILILKEFISKEDDNYYIEKEYYTDRELDCKITYITDFGLQTGYVCMGIKLI